MATSEAILDRSRDVVDRIERSHMIDVALGLIDPIRYKGGLSPTHRKILRVLLNPKSNAETNREIAKAIGKSQTMVDHCMLDIYKAFGVRTCRGLIRFQSEIKRVLGV